MPVPFARSASQTRPTFSRDFAGLKTLDHGAGPAINFTRGTNATYFDASGTLRFAPHNAIRNSQAGGAVVGVIGSGGAFPTNWERNGITGISYEVVGTGNSNGLNYVDIKMSGTNTSGSLGFLILRFDPTQQVAASSGQLWTGSFYAALIAGSASGITQGPRIMLQGSTAAPSFVESSQTNLSLTSSLQRFSQSRTLTSATTERVNVQFYGEVANGQTINLTLRIAAPQLERNATPSEYIPTTATANFDQPRFDHDPATGASRGLLIEEARTNSIRNSQAGGSTNGVIGSGGVVATNWSAQTISGLTTQVVGSGTQNGMSYVDIRYSGTNASASVVFPSIVFEIETQVAASSGQTWTGSFYAAIAGGTTSGINSIRADVYESTAAGSFLANSNTTHTLTSSLARYSHTRTLTEATTGRVSTRILLFIAGSATIDLTLRIAAPQLEQGAFPTSYIPTTTAAATRSADSAVVTPISSFYNQSEGTFVTESSYAYANSATNDSNRVTLQADDTSLDNRVLLYNLGTNGAGGGQIIVSGATQLSIGGGNATPDDSVVGINVAVKIGIAFTTNNARVAKNGTLAIEDTSVTVPALSRLRIGASGAGFLAAMLNGHIRRIAYYPRRLSNTLLQQLTT